MLGGKEKLNDNWGGARIGSGRKPLPESKKRKGYTFQLTKEELQFIESIEGKNRSEKLRKLIKQYKNLKKQVDFSSEEC